MGEGHIIVATLSLLAIYAIVLFTNRYFPLQNGMTTMATKKSKGSKKSKGMVSRLLSSTSTTIAPLWEMSAGANLDTLGLNIPTAPPGWI